MFETDAVDVSARAGWSVNITGQVQPVTDPAAAARYAHALGAFSLAHPGPIVHLHTELVSGYRMEPGPAQPG